MSRYKTYREPRKRGYDDESYSSSDRNHQPGASYSTRAPVETPIVEATVSWFNADKGFGFVKTADGSDAFLHIRAFESVGHADVAEGARLKVKIEQGQKGPQVSEVLEVDASCAVDSREPSTRRPPRTQSHSAGPEDQGEGTVKFFNVEKGFGFIGVEGHDKDVFVHATTLERSGLSSLREGQRVFITFGAGKKGPEAKSVRMQT